MTSQTPIQVAVAVIFTGTDTVLLTRRAQGVHLAGLWEFPGGKLEPGESPRQALQREIREELGIEISAATPILQLPFQYPEKSVLLHVFRVDKFNGEAQGMEGQVMQSCALSELKQLPFPAANAAIVRWLQLPDWYLINAPSDAENPAAMARRIEHCPGMFQYRAPGMPAQRYQAIAEQLRIICQQQGSPLLLNHSLEMFQRVAADGLHLSATQAQRFSSRPIAKQQLLGCSCHNEAELAQAERLEADFVVLSLVQPSLSHPQQPAMGWDGFARLCVNRPFAVYALGGMQATDLGSAHQLGARGIAGIRGIGNFPRHS